MVGFNNVKNLGLKTSEELKNTWKNLDVVQNHHYQIAQLVHIGLTIRKSRYSWSNYSMYTKHLKDKTQQTLRLKL